MSFVVVGINHHSAPIAIREAVAFAQAELHTATLDLLGLSNISGAAIISTCNRTELFITHSGINDANTLLQWLAENRNIDEKLLHQHAYSHEGSHAVRHVFRVACGLDSMVLGEPQILGQLKAAARLSQSLNALCPLLHQVFQRAFAAAKVVRSQTEIGAHSISMASAAVKLVKRIFANFTDLNVLFIGAGEMIQLCATHMASEHPAHIWILNRSLPRAQTLADNLSPSQHTHVEALPLAELPQILPMADVVVSCTASALPIVGLGLVQSAFKNNTHNRKHRPMFMLDLAVPRDIEPQVAELEDVFLYTVDDLSQLVNTHKTLRSAAASAAEPLLQAELNAFETWLHKRSATAHIQTLQQAGLNLCQTELQHAKRLLDNGMPAHEALENLAHRLTAKFLHGPYQLLHNTTHPQRPELLQWLPTLFSPKDPP